MFWRFGGYATVSAVDAILEKPEFTLEELLEESDLIQELKAHNTKLIEYLREEPILERLLEYVVAPKLEPVVSEEEVEKAEKDGESEDAESSSAAARIEAEEEQDEKEKKRNRYAYVAAEILSSDSWSLSAALLENTALLRKFWDFLTLAPPLDPLQASYFTKVNEALLDKKTEEMLDFFKSIDGVVKSMLQHVDSPMVMDLLLKIISLEKQPGGEGIVDWLHSQDLMPILLSFLGAEHSWATQTSAGDFLKAIITISANASQNEQSCIGPNELTRQLVSYTCVEKLIADMLKGGNPLTVGVGIVIEVIRKNNSDYDPEVGAEANSAPSNRDPIYLGTLLRMFAKHVPDFMALILSPNHTVGGGDKGPISIKRKELATAFGTKIEPLGFDRFKTCELMAELLHCSNMGLLNELGSEEYVQARDQEREKLKAEGKLNPPSTSRRNSGDDDLTMKSSLSGRADSQSHDGSRRLEVQNATEDDGFEEVNPAVEFDERPDTEDYSSSATKPEPLSFMDKDADEFVDEPLSSPRLNTGHEHNTDPAMTVLPLSPTKELSQEIAGLNVNKANLSGAESTAIAPSMLSTTIGDVKSLEALEDLADVHIGEMKNVQEQVVLGSAAESAELESMSPHPEDKPAPLFSKKADTSPSKPSDNVTPQTDTALLQPKSNNEGQESFALQSGDDTVIHDSVMESSVILKAPDASDEAGDSSLSPVVGDYLKQQFVEHHVVPTIIDFFFRFPWNNFLHNVVYDVVQQVFNGPMDRGFNRTLATDLFDTGDITMRIVVGQKKSDESQQNNKMRLGYMGHLTLIAEEVVKFTERHPPELLAGSVLDKVMNDDWIQYVEITLSETRERDNAILGGVRPDMINSTRSAGMGASSSFGGQSSALADAGLNGGNTTSLDGMDMTLTNGIGSTSGFGISGGSNILSGFGSSSDDDEEEEPEDHEDEDGSRKETAGAEFSRYITTPSTTTAITSSESEPPANLPPPPPLNTPSAARRRLAARLAMKNVGQSSTEAEASSCDILPSTQYEAKLPPYDRGSISNPFATDEDSDPEEDESMEVGRNEAVTLGDLEAEAEGKGVLPPGTALVDDPQPLTEDQLGQAEHILNSSDESDSSSEDDEDFGSAGVGYGSETFAGASREDLRKKMREKGRRPSTTEAKRRTSLEDDDEEEEAAHKVQKDLKIESSTHEDDDGELVEFRHDELQGVQGAK